MMSNAVKRKNTVLQSKTVEHDSFVSTAGVGGYEPSTSECFGCVTPSTGSNLQDCFEVRPPCQTDRSWWGWICFCLASSMFKSADKSATDEGAAAEKGLCLH